MTHPPDDDLGAIALTAARAGADAISAVLAAGGLNTGYKSGGHDMVTEADRASERAVIDVIRRARPDDTILGEEGGVHEGSTDVRWLVDPLDGTANFVYGRADFAVSVGVEVAGKPAAGAILKPADGRWLMAGKAGFTTGGADSSVAVAAPGLHDTAAADAIVGFGMPYSLQGRKLVLSCIAELVPRLRAVRIIGSAATDLAAVALGNSDGFIGFGLAEWDTAAGVALVLAAGGVVRPVELPGLPPAIVAGSPVLVQELTELLAAA